MLSVLHKTGYFHMRLYPFSGNESLLVRLRMGAIGAGMWGVFPISACGEVHLVAGTVWEKETKRERSRYASLPRKTARSQKDQVAFTARPIPRTTSPATRRPDKINDKEAPAGSGPPVSGNIEPNDSPVHSLTQMPAQKYCLTSAP
jgi:hypothetical protein